ncbi:ATPase component of various ABC-type transport systems with duplicated ATPase domain [Pleurocapsa sp. PCC 7327]|uniref:ABC transporter ATP-binding protein n=1 Tax=Pleurocapsa sp. PCC 7327 TaxID=118163 RepID=UPI00029FB8E0|nr:ABC transporter ATP-binding protein [Pleurocapsa sp. PCC 7327]AFY79275.1 ATPase component of various ABC-type transport systems with duplicated ATPase domain [Pleurocapsa sp. PCC 7327]
MSDATVNIRELTSDTILDVRNLRVEFLSDSRNNFSENSSPRAVDDISFQLKRGQILGIVGESGSGKSVTSLAIMGLIPSPGKISGGEIWFRPARENNQARNARLVNLLALSEEKRRNYRGGEIAMIFQEPMSALNPVYTIGFQIIEAIRLHQNVAPEQAKNQAIALLQEVKLIPSDEQLENEYLEKNKGNKNTEAGLVTQRVKNYIKQYKQSILKRYPHQLSGGQLQRVTIAMAISCNPTILIADEPTTALDVTVQAEILHLLRELCKTHRDMSMIFISHDLGVINQIADAVVVMYGGKIVEAGNKDKILYEPKHPYTKGLLACRPRLHSQLEILPVVENFMIATKDSATGKVLSIQEKEPPEFKTISPQKRQERLSSLQQKENLLSVSNLSVLFPVRGMFGQTKVFFKAVDNVSFEVKPGETLGLVGESGCGKSTLARTILRLIPATTGKIKFRFREATEEEDISRLSMGDEKLRFLRRKMQIVFQNPYNSLNPRLTIGKAIMEPMTIHNLGKSSRARREKVKDLLGRVGLNPDWFDRYPHELSGGQRQRVCIARALAVDPEFIICDESVSALDVSVQAGVLNLLKKLQKDFHLTYIFISHDLSVVKFMSDRILVMNQGKIEEMDIAENIINNPQKDYTKKLIASIPQF